MFPILQMREEFEKIVRVWFNLLWFDPSLIIKNISNRNIREVYFYITKWKISEVVPDLHKFRLDSSSYIQKYVIFFIIVDITLRQMNIDFKFFWWITHFISIQPLLWYSTQVLTLYSVIILSFQSLFSDVMKIIILKIHNYSSLWSFSHFQWFTILGTWSITKNPFTLSTDPILPSQNALKTTAIDIILFLIKIQRRLSLLVQRITILKTPQL